MGGGTGAGLQTGAMVGICSILLGVTFTARSLGYANLELVLGQLIFGVVTIAIGATLIYLYRERAPRYRGKRPERENRLI